MLSTRRGIRPLGAADLDAFLALTARDPVVNVFAEHRARSTNLDPKSLGGQMWGRFVDGELTAACHVGANLVPVQVEAEDAIAFAERAHRNRGSVSTIFGPEAAVRGVYDALGGDRATPRDLRWGQPHLELASAPLIAPDPAVRRSTSADLNLLYPACVAMYTEEVGVSPEGSQGGDHYRARVEQLISRGWSFVRIDDGRLVFKAEVACVSPYAAQIQGVYVDPAHRGRGLAAAGVAAVVRQIHTGIAPVASLYVNEWNVPARRAYARCGFRESARFATIMFE
ncbi:MAG: GNAT family N-acetyltransferase [Nocardioides sp.]